MNWQVTTEALDRLDWYINERPAGSSDIVNNAVTIKLPKASGERKIRLEGFAQNEKLAALQVSLKCTN